jgi:hypothetical protein
MSVSDKIRPNELVDEPSNRGSAQVGTIHQTDTVQDTDSHDETSINAMDDLPLLLRAELALVVILAGTIAMDILVQARWSFLDVVEGHVGWRTLTGRQVGEEQWI